jgi:hypothetical protein
MSGLYAQDARAAIGGDKHDGTIFVGRRKQ